MSAGPTAAGRARTPHVGPVAAPVGALARTELRLHLRHHVVAAVAVLTLLWVALLLALPAEVRRGAVPWVLFLDLASVGFLLVPALTVVERGNGVTAALRLTRLSPARALVVRIGMLTAWSLLAAVAVVVAARPSGAVGVVVAAALTTVLLSLLAVVMVGRQDTLTGYLPRVPLVGVPLLLPALVSGIGLWDGAVLWASPATAAFALLAGRWSWIALGWLLLCIAMSWVAAVRIGFDVVPRSPGSRSRGRRTPEPSQGPTATARGAVRAFARTDRRTLLGDGMLVLLVGGVPLLAVLVRLATGPGVGWIQARYGIDVTPHLPAFGRSRSCCTPRRWPERCAVCCSWRIVMRGCSPPSRPRGHRWRP